MTDHKAEWVLVPRVATEEMLKATLDGMMLPAVVGAAERVKASHAKLYAAMIAAAPAASEAQAAAEDRILYGTSIMLDGKRIDPRTVQIDPAASKGEDGAVAVARDLLKLAEILDMSGPKKHKDDRIDIMWDVMTAAARHLREHAATLTRPAAQVAATPKHDEGRDALPRLPAPQKECWIGHQLFSAEQMRDYARATLATQPAARRVTDGVWVEPVVVPGSPHAHIVRFRCGQQRFDIGDALDTMEEAKAFAAMFRHALESFAQPAEGVSGE